VILETTVLYQDRPEVTLVQFGTFWGSSRGGCVAPAATAAVEVFNQIVKIEENLQRAV
jgi:hypothetical protein